MTGRYLVRYRCLCDWCSGSWVADEGWHELKSYRWRWVACVAAWWLQWATRSESRVEQVQ